MSSLPSLIPTPPPLSRVGTRHLYASLFGEHGRDLGQVDELTASASWGYLRARLDEAAARPDTLPADPRALADWCAANHERTASAYQDYLGARRAGAPRRYFRNRSHAIAFLRAVAPTKLVDGAWLYGILRRAADQRLAPLVRTYLEELGDGVAAKNHVVVYRELLAATGGDEPSTPLSDDHYTQGAIQLALAHHADRLLPETIGFNLGYEQLPLHLPITAYELEELDIDPHYFTLHVTIDNAASGHAQKAVKAVLDCLPAAGDRDAFYRRVRDGYKLNDLGVGTERAVASFDLERELVAVLAQKAPVGAMLHGDRCRIAGRAVADWLGSPDDMPRMLQALASTGWIRRGKPVEESRFWRVLHDARGPMFGVFDGYASQLLHDWITDVPTTDVQPADDVSPRPRRRFVSAAATTREPEPPAPALPDVEAVVRHHLDVAAGMPQDDDVDALIERVSGLRARDETLAALRGFLSPANHASPAGLLATRIYSAVHAR